jgi:hypothetical protein
VEDLQWHRENGDYVTGDNGLAGQGASEFFARISKRGSEWLATTFTFGGILTSAPYRTLAAAKTDCEMVWRNVESGCSA